MKGDFTRQTFRPEKHYSSIRMQQGRVQLDADWNEQMDIQAYQQQALSAAFVGQSGTPKASPGFALSTQSPPADTADLGIAAGRFYVDGLLCELDRGTTYKAQPDYPSPPLPTVSGLYLVYLDVISRHVTALEDPQLREPALSGPDTTTRLKNTWQVKWTTLPAATLPTDPLNYSTIFPPASQAVLKAQVSTGGTGSGSGSYLPPGAGYAGIENQLYRVEIHQGGDLSLSGSAVTFKWSRDNGSIAAAWVGQSGNQLTISNPGREGAFGFEIGQWIELLDDSCELAGTPGILVRLTDVQGATLTIDTSPLPSGVTVSLANFPRHPKVRRWDMASGAIPVQKGQWLPLENGIQVYFDGSTCSTGDYWLLPARCATRNIEWPRDNNGPVAQPPQGITHHYAPLAQVSWSNGAFSAVQDRRFIFPSLADLRNIDPLKYDNFIANHRHTGNAGDSPQIQADGIASGAVDGSKINPQSSVTVGQLTVKGAVTLNHALSIGPLSCERVLSLDGNGYVSLPSMTNDFTHGLTIEAWIKVTSFSAWTRFFELGSGAPSNNILLYSPGASPDSGSVVFQINNGTSSGVPFTAANVLSATDWVHFCVTMDASGNTIIYKNGQSVAQVTGMSLPSSGVTRTNNYIGGSSWAFPGTARLNGQVAMVRLWERGLSAQEVANYHNPWCATVTTNLAGFWRLNDLLGSTMAADSSGNGRNGTVTVNGGTTAFIAAPDNFSANGGAVQVITPLTVGSASSPQPLTVNGALTVGSSTANVNATVNGALSVSLSDQSNTYSATQTLIALQRMGIPNTNWNHGASIALGGGTAADSGKSTLYLNVSPKFGSADATVMALSSDSVQMSTALTVNGTLTASGALTVGSSTANANAAFNGTLTISGALTVGSSTANANATFNGTLATTGALTVGSSTANANATVNGALNVSSASHSSGGLSVYRTDASDDGTVNYNTQPGADNSAWSQVKGAGMDMITMSRTGRLGMLNPFAASIALGCDNLGNYGRGRLDFKLSAGYSGPDTLVLRLAQDGTVTAKGPFVTNSGLSDVAETFVHNEAGLEPGDVVVADPARTEGLVRSTRPYQKGLLGALSEKPGLSLRSDSTSMAGLLGLCGRIPVKVCLEGGTIGIGDLVTSSSQPGRAMRATRAGRVIGMALQAYAGAPDVAHQDNQTDQADKIIVFINPHYWAGDDSP